jgi:hypothetical protein
MTTQSEVDIENAKTSQKEIDFFNSHPPKTYTCYAYPNRCEVGTWTGQKLGRAVFGHEWTSNMGDIRQFVDIIGINGKRYSGIYYKSGSDLVRMKEVK